MNEDVYRELAREQPDDAVLGGALVTLVEPLPGCARSYNRWYEDDHIYAGAMMSPWVFAGKRFIATREQSANSLPPGAGGRFLALYWYTAGQARPVEEWGVTRLVDSLVPQGRGNTDRRHHYSAFHDHQFSHVFDPDPMRDIHALDHPYAGLVLELVDLAETGTRADCLARLRDEFVPAHAPAGAGQCVALTPRVVDGWSADVGLLGPDDLRRRVCLLWFLRRPLGDPTQPFHDHAATLSAGGYARLTFALPMVPAVPGTDTYMDQM
ncbi:hypothetical protein ABZ215_15010 [Amycolatopsis sp. NPDC006131]|uniref:hypothetical protein n=1 Tax=Amycolatopsis sp. NPDC006131 TaxID=3156731 RepID=UPI0033AA6CF7